MSENTNSFTIIIPLEGIEKIKSSKTVTAAVHKNIKIFLPLSGISQVSFALVF